MVSPSRRTSPRLWTGRSATSRTRCTPRRRGSPRRWYAPEPGSAGPPMTSDWQPGTTVLKEFTVQRIIGAGGFGQVALVHSLRSGELYAAKRLLDADLVHQGHLIAEAQRWIALPAHPYITECRFTRTVGDELVVFSEFVPGGSLDDRIRSGKLYSDDETVTLRRILTVATQVAYGLDAAHATGLLHLDVKPANVLFGAADAAKITDFGLADVPHESVKVKAQLGHAIDYIVDDPLLDTGQARAMKGSLGALLLPEYEHLPGLTAPQTRGHTSAYASPEQTDGLPVGPAADVWSWALTVVELLVGDRTWQSGAVAMLVLQAARRERLTDRSIAVPPPLAELLGSCFQEDPQERPVSLRMLADELRTIAERETGGPLADDVPPRPSAWSPDRQAHGRRSMIGVEREDPREFLRYAYATAGLDEREAVSYWPTRAGSLKSQHLEDVRALNEAWRVLAEIPEGADPGLSIVRARCAAALGEVQADLGDLTDAIERYRTSVRILEALAPEESRGFLSPSLNCLAVLLRRDGDTEESLRVSDRAIEAARQERDPKGAAHSLSAALQTKANALACTGEAEALYRASAAAAQSAGDDEGQAKAIANLAACLERNGSPDRAAELWDDADRKLARFDGPGHRDIQAVRACLWLNRAALASSGSDAELDCARRAVELYAPLVRAHGMHTYAGHLGRAHLLAGQGHELRDRLQEALSAYREASEHLEAAVLRNGELEFTAYLAWSYDHESAMVAQLHNPEQAVEPAQRSVDMWRHVAALDGLGTSGPSLAEALSKLAEALRDAGRLDESEQWIAEGLRVVDDPEYSSEGHGDVTKAWVYRNRAVTHRRRGEFDEALHWCQAALDVLATSAGHDGVLTRILVRQTLTGLYGDCGLHRAALEECESTMVEIDSYVRQGILSAFDLADGFHRLANARMQFGLPSGSATAARSSLDAYAQLIANGRVDLVSEAARARVTLALALMRTGELHSAARELEEGVHAFRNLPATDVALANGARIHLGPSGEPAEELSSGDTPSPPGAQLRESIVCSFTRLLVEVRDTLDSGPGDMPERLARFRTLHSRAAHLGGNGATEKASQLLEKATGQLTWLARAFPGDEVEALRAETGQLLGWYAMRCGRGGAAEHGFRIAVDSYRTLTSERGRPEHAERWCKAYIGWAAARVFEGDDVGAEDVVREMRRDLRHLRPEQARAFEQRAHDALREFREFRESLG
ncbi:MULTISPECIES: serine/threonine-protein kinase [unclassified Streptomyces]|uniref:serine/threonine-protein kinase n=1 Tax=unclassified Streptomyces TaxID=2593676 RepID=UPI001E5D7FAE|nr:protein kinase [Streptomyces sp. CB02980]MCB8905514.1 serine/threonine-protein kinase [Streptomyces sp. CB02980]